MIPGALVDALRKHLPDSARPLIIPRIPKARTLALLARDRGWLEEARPVVLRTLLEDGGVPNEWETLLRPDRLPDFVVLTPTPCYLNQPGAVPWQQDLSALRIEWSGPRSSGTTALETSIAGRVRAVLEESRKASEPEFHLSLQFCEFLAHGEEPALTALLGVLVHHGEEVTPWHGVLARQWMRSAGGAELPAAPGSLRTALHPLRADHFEFDRAQCLWIRRNPPVP